MGLRYFNAFGPRQDPDGAYAAVIPKWTAMFADDEVFINGDGETSRDLCFVANAIQANLPAATPTPTEARNQVYNVAVGDRTTLNQLFDALCDALAANGLLYEKEPAYRDLRPGDVRLSQADVGKAFQRLGYQPSHAIRNGIASAVPWYLAMLERKDD